MALADIQKKSAEERKREKRLVHATNALSRDYLDSKTVKAKTKEYKEGVEYLTKSLLDYLFFEERKELKELNEHHIQQFLLVYAPQKLNISPDIAGDIPDVLKDFLLFLDTAGHIKNGTQLSETVKANKRSYLKLGPPPKKTTKTKKTVTRKAGAGRTSKKPKAEEKVGRNDPCPCGSGKKYKKCCGQAN
jgi:preprotein translocase subunit SecA